jgi:NET1-associated nuclear protein 1 (U3 small nucleolar RNA-associated protein 17)
VSIFGPSTGRPHKTYTLPFTLRNIVWYPQSLSKAKETSTFHLVGITDSWDVVFCGDDVHPLAGEGSFARGLIAGSQEPRKRTLFQDIFGDSALSMVPIDTAIPKTAATTPKPGIGKDVITNMLSGPAYLIPPLETLFEPLMNLFLTPRPPEDVATPGPSMAGDEEDAIMDVDGPLDSPFVSGAPTERVIDAKEMDALIGLFRHHSVKGT